MCSTQYPSSVAVADKTLVIDLSAPARVADLPALAGAFLRWWGAELSGLLPSSLRAQPRAQRLKTRLLVSDGTWHLQGDNTSPLEFDATVDDQTLAERIMNHSATYELSRMEVLLSRKDTLLRRIELPVMAEGDMRSAIELQIDRMTPFTTEAVRFAHRVAERDAAAGKATVDVAIVPRARIEPLEARFGAMGISPISIDVDNGSGAGLGFDLRKPASEDAQRRRQIINIGLVALAITVWLMALNAWTTSGEGEIASWQAKIAELRPAAERTAALKHRVDALTQPFTVANAHDPARTLSILQELTHILPDQTRVLELRLNGNKLQISGLSNNASDLIAKLEASPSFANVQFTSPVMRSPNSTRDRFELAMDVERVKP